MEPITSLPPGLVAVTGGERSGKTSLLRRLAGDATAPGNATAQPDARYLEPTLPGRDPQTPRALWTEWAGLCPAWNAALQLELTEALQMQVHQDKQLFMLSAGSRRKAALIALLSSGATITCLDQPYAALDMASIRQLRGFLQDMADHPTRTWVVADYEADAQLPWKRVIALD